MPIMPEMPDHDLRTTIDALCARLQSDLQAQVAQVADRFTQERETVRREAEAKAAEVWTGKVEAVRQKWQGRLQAGLADAAAEVERRFATESERARLEIENLMKAAAEAEERHRKGIEAVRDEWQGRLQAGLADAAADADRRVVAETDRIRRELEHAAAQSTERVRREVEQGATASITQLRAELEQAATQSTMSLRAELEQAVAHASEIDRERVRLEGLLAEERARATTEAGAVVDARAAERQAQLAVVERLLHAVRTIDAGRSLSDTLTALTEAAASVAPRAALFIVDHGADRLDLQPWKAAGFSEGALPRQRGGAGSTLGVLDAAVTTGRSVSTAAGPAPAFAELPADRAGLAVPITVGGYCVAVLYVDDGVGEESEAPASWPEAAQVLAAHASACLTEITAVRTTQAMQQMSGAAAARPVAGGGAEDSSARRYARLLVSEIKLYNEAAVRTGREKRDLLNRLAPEIERARRLYEERVSPSVGARATYFQQELVHTLADGDSALLGGAL
jgi:hypothetical protein